jgi:hypothetical protein
MPLTASGEKVKAAMSRQYGADKGERVFYASINKGKPGASKWHRKPSARRMSGKR